MLDFGPMDTLRILRNAFFEATGNQRWKRVALIALFVATIWCFADWMSGSLQINLMHDFICLGMAIVIERLLPWGKVN